MSVLVAATSAGLEGWFETLSGRRRHLTAAGMPWLGALRARALEAFWEVGLPGRKHEEWRHTNLAPLAGITFRPADSHAPAKPASGLLAALPGERVLLVNGRPLVSQYDVSAARVFSLLSAIREFSDLARTHLGRYARIAGRPFVALNTALFEDGLLVRIPAGATIEQPLVLIHQTEAGGEAVASHTRTLILAGRQSRVTIVEAWSGPDGAVYLETAVTEVVAEEEATVDYTRLELASPAAFHFGALDARLAPSASLTAHSIALGGRLARSEIGVALEGEGAACTLDGLYLVSGNQHLDTYTLVDHVRPHTTSAQLYKGILDDQGEAVFNGRVIVRQQASKADALQRNRNLLLSKQAAVTSKPQLEIYNDDVRCTHAATAGQLDPEALFYLRSRGASEHEARVMLTLGFAGEVTGRLQVPALRAALQDFLRERIGRGARQ